MQKIEGEVTRNGNPCYSGLYPEIGHFGFRLWRLDEKNSHQICNIGPHMNLCLPATCLFHSVQREEFINSLHYTFSGPYLGSIDEFHGVAALDSGPLPNIVERIDLDVLMQDDILFLAMSCIGRRKVRLSDKTNRPDDLAKPQTFGIKCSIPIAMIPSVVKGRSGLFLQKKLECETFQEYFEAVRNIPPEKIE